MNSRIANFFIAVAVGGLGLLAICILVDLRPRSAAESKAVSAIGGVAIGLFYGMLELVRFIRLWRRGRLNAEL